MAADDTRPSPTIVYVHGVFGPKPKSIRKLLRQVAAGAPPVEIDPASLVVVDYQRIVMKSGRDDRKVDRLRPAPVGDQEKGTSYNDRSKKLRASLAVHASKGRVFGDEIPVDIRASAGRILRKRRLKEAQRYRRRRHQVRKHVLGELDRAGSADMIVIAHSLGSVVMADLIPYLGPNRHIRLLVTLGSPLGVPHIWKRTLRGFNAGFPYHSVTAWLNIWSETDYVTGFSGIGRRYKQAVDLQIAATGPLVRGAKDFRHPKKSVLRHHKLRAYAAHPALASAIASALDQSDESA